MAFILTSSAFGDGDPIPDRHTQDGPNLSPPLDWRDPPPGTQSFALIVEDPDAPHGTFRHWAVIDIPGDRNSLPENAGSGAAGGLRHAINDFGKRRYDGPAPPPGHGRHHYRFRLAALGIPHLDIGPAADSMQVWQAARHHILGQAELVGVYERPAQRDTPEMPPQRDRQAKGSRPRAAAFSADKPRGRKR